MTSREEIISELLSQEEYFELNDEAAEEIFDILVENKTVMDKLLIYYTFIDLDKKKINTKILNWKIYNFESDVETELSNGILEFNGACDVVGFDNSLKLKIKTENFNICEVWAVDMDDDTEIAFVEQGQYIRKMERETFQSGPQTYGNRYKYIPRGKV